MKIKFAGAARTVTGSQHLLNVNSMNILLDCGLFQGKRQEAYDINKNFTFFSPPNIDKMILSHAHIDHSGNIPSLCKKGFEKEIFCTHATKDLCTYMLRDSGHIQEKDIEFINKKKIRKGEMPFKPLYTENDAVNSLSQFIDKSYQEVAEFNNDFSFTFYDAGHILGSSMIYMNITENHKHYSLCYSGDLGRKNLAIIKDPDIIPTPDYLILESTYGGRTHQPAEYAENKLSEIINKTINKKGKVIVPAFSVGRTQELIFALHNLFENKKIPSIPIFVDSPLSVNITSVFRRHPECFDEETNKYLINEKDPFSFNKLTYIESANESKKLNDFEEPCIIISSSGMCETGRILHHLANNIENERNTVLIVGYNAEHTLGRKLVEGQTEVNILGDVYKVKAGIEVMNSLSAHADRNEILDYLKNLDLPLIKKIFLIHGDYDQQLKLKDALIGIGIKDVVIPLKGDEVEI